MATNQFLVVAPGPVPNIASQATYAADPIVTTGNVSGVAKSAILNKAFRQSSVMSAVVAQYICDTTGQDAIDDGTTATLLGNLKLALNGKILAVRLITTNATYTPTAGTKNCWVRLVGGGGAGGGCGSTGTGNTAAGVGGGAGSYVETLVPVATLTGQTMQIGLGGIGAVNVAGPAGGTTNFGAVLTAPGGRAGSVGQNLLPPWLLGGSGNTAAPTGGTLFNNPGAAGVGSFSLNLSAITSGRGGSGPFGVGGQENGSVRGNGVAGAGYGSGGSGAVELSAGPGGLAGGNGTNGCILIVELG